MDDRQLDVSCFGTGELKQYDVSDASSTTCQMPRTRARPDRFG
ncbi:MAG: hypothetical protein ABR528_03645 [Pseudonocardiaceae bacterium]